VTANDDSQLIENSSAAASWSGFVYQGKICLYTVIKMMTDNLSDYSGFGFRIEHIEDFAIFQPNDKAYSMHQVKAVVSSARDEVALGQVCRVAEDYCTEDTKRFFHVATESDDDSDFSDGVNTVEFYKYDDGLKYLPISSVDEKVEQVIGTYLDVNGLNNTEPLVTYKRMSLYSLIDSTVNQIHVINQSTNASQFQAASEVKLLFSDIADILIKNVINPGDTEYILQEFRRFLIEQLDSYINDNLQEEPCIKELLSCRQRIAKLDESQLEKLYYSFNPKKKVIESTGFGGQLTNYIDILDELNGLIADIELPHYKCSSNKKFLPSNFNLSKKRQATDIQNIRSNLASNKSLYVLYEYENLILNSVDESQNSEIDLSEIMTDVVNDRFTHNDQIEEDGFISTRGVQQHSKKLNKKKIKFISIGRAKEKLGV